MDLCNVAGNLGKIALRLQFDVTSRDSPSGNLSGASVSGKQALGLGCAAGLPWPLSSRRSQSCEENRDEALL